MAEVCWDFEDWDIVEDALEDFVAALRADTPEEWHMTQEDYDRKVLRLRALIAESHTHYMDEYLLWKQEHKTIEDK